MAQAKSIESLEEFLGVLQNSKLFSPELIQKLRQDLDGSDKQPIDIARMLVKNCKLSKWQAGQLLTGFFKFRQGQFVLRDQLGKSRLGSLFLAHDEKRGQLVAIRSLSKAAAANADKVKRFVSAARAASKLKKHENVVRVLEVSSESGRHLIVTEFVNGRDLNKHIDEQGPLSAKQAATYLRQAADALTLAHKQEVVHGSLHPACLLVDTEGVVKIADWGLAPLRDTKRGFCSPEQRAGNPADPATDVYSLGSTLYYLLTGQVPTAADGKDEEAKQLAPLNQLRKDVPGPLVALCEQMMAADPSARLGAMQDVVSRLADIVASGAEGEAYDDADVVELDFDDEEDDRAELDDDIVVAVADGTDKTVVVPPTQKASVDRAPTVTVEDAHKTTPIGDTVAFEISTGKRSKASPIGGISIHTKKKKTKSKKNAAKEKPVAESAEEEELVTSARPVAGSQGTATRREDAKPGNSEPPEPKTKKKLNVLVVVIVGLAALFGLTLLGGGVLLVMFLSSSGREAVAQLDAASSATTEEDVDPESSDPEIDPEDVPDEVILIEDDPEATDTNATNDEGTGTTADETPTSDPATDNSGDGVATDGTNAGGENTDSVQPDPDGAETQVKPGSDTDTEKPAEDSEEEKKKKAEADAAAKKKSDLAAAAKQKADEKRKADEKKKRAAAIFASFQSTVNLPDIPAAGSAASPFVLGKIDIAPSDVCFISMTGGDNAARGRAEFLIRNAKSGTAPRDWELVVRDDSVDTIVATLALPETSLSFHWQPAATDCRFAGNLRNCTLKMTAGSAKPHQLALRKPLVFESVPIDLTKSSTQARWSVDSPPDPSTLQVIASLKSNKIVLDPPQPITALKGLQWIYLGQNKDTTVLAIKLETNVTARGIQITLKPFIKFSGQKPLAYNKGTKKRVMQAASQRGRQQLQGQVSNYQAAFKKAKGQQRNQVQVALGQAEAQLRAFDQMVQQVGQLDQIEKSYDEALLDFKVIYRTLQGETVLVRTQAGGATP